MSTVDKRPQSNQFKELSADVKELESFEKARHRACLFALRAKVPGYAAVNRGTPCQVKAMMPTNPPRSQH
jgi:hypothetical protein